MIEKFRVLTEYECGRAQMAIEWVARSQKPIVEIGGRPVEGCDLKSLAHDLNRCIAQSGEVVRAFVMPDGIPEYCCYGFYRYPWAMKAMLAVWGVEQWPTDPGHWLWLQGLLFGYSADAIQRFISSASYERDSNSLFPSYTPFCRLRRVEIYGSLARLVQHRSSLSGKYQKPR